MGEGVSPQLPRLASLDWPPPPSPAGPGRPLLQGGISPSGNRSFHGRMVESRARAELWALRTEVDREKVRAVAPYPFFGRAMRFEDDLAALQISEDGRFSYSVRATSADTQERDVPEHSPRSDSQHRSEVAERHMVSTYEGTFSARSLFGGHAGVPAGVVMDDAGSANIEAQAMLRYEMEEHPLGTRFFAVERCTVRFLITIGPAVHPKAAVVAPLSQPRTPRSAHLRCKQLPYVGQGAAPKVTGFKPRRHATKGGLLKAALDITVRPVASAGRSHTNCSRMISSSSAPLLPPMDTGAVTDWRETYRNRAELILRRRGGF